MKRRNAFPGRSSSHGREKDKKAKGLKAGVWTFGEKNERKGHISGKNLETKIGIGPNGKFLGKEEQTTRLNTVSG